MTRYVLRDREVVEEPDLLTWAQWMEAAAERRVARTEVNDAVTVSTVFLGLDHRFGLGPPLLFETMIFGGPHAEYTDRYETWAEAEAGHKKAVEIAELAEAAR